MDIDTEINEYTKKLKELKQGYEKTIQDFSKELKLMNNSVRQMQSKMSFQMDKVIDHPKDEDSSKQYFTDIFWGGENSNYPNQLAATTNKGHAYLFNTAQKTLIEDFNFTNSELNTVSIEPTESNLLAAGGFDGGIYVTNINSVKSKEKKEASDDSKKFSGHQGVVSCCRFLNPFYLLSSSFDSVILLWDINSQGKSINSYHDHTSEVSGLDVNEMNGNIFATGSGDTFVKLWDIREKKACVCTFKGSDSNVSCVKFLPGRLTTLAAGSEDSTIRIYDLRALKELSCLRKDGDNNSINSVGFSKSGQVLFASSNNSSKIHFWDIFDDQPTPFHTYDHGENVAKGVKMATIDNTGKQLAYITEDKINILK